MCGVSGRHPGEGRCAMIFTRGLKVWLAAQPVPGGLLGPRLMADLVLGKYLYHQPPHRQPRALEWEGGITLSAVTLCRTIGRIAEAAVRAIGSGPWTIIARARGNGNFNSAKRWLWFSHSKFDNLG
ncbi:hypothetical protein EON80_00395 [bacterium]|nr:MAG: hypothetical protein EON80_00395 [bacterium]